MKAQKIFLIFLIFAVNGLFAQNTARPSQILINNVQVFNGKDNKLTKANILIKDNLISSISSVSIPVDNDLQTQIIDGQGKFLIPGLIDAHSHIMFESIPMAKAMTSEYAYLAIVATEAAKKQLLRGFTSVRDLGGGAIVVQKAIDEGLAVGPRIFPSGAFISQTGGHGDFGLPSDVPRKIGEMSYAERNGIAALADGVDQVLMRSREQLRQGATQLKLMAGGGVSSNYDPIDVMQYTEDEFRAAVSAAENWGTYVTVHAYTPKAIQAAVNAGVKCIDHGQLADEETAKMMAEKGIWWSLQPFLDDEESNSFPEGSENRRKQLLVSNGTDKAYKLAKKYDIKTAWGTDCLFNPSLAAKQGKQLSKMTRWYTPFEVLKMATYDNAQLLSLSGERNPYRKGKIGEITEGAYADLILVNANPLEDLTLIEDPMKNFLLIMKDGTVYKNILNN